MRIKRARPASEIDWFCRSILFFYFLIPRMRFVDDFDRFVDYSKKKFAIKHLPLEKPFIRV